MDDRLVRLLAQNDQTLIAREAAENKTILSRLTVLTYHPDEEIVRRAVEAFGYCARQIALIDPDYVRNHLRRLFWLVNDESGGICLYAPEMIGEVLSLSPGWFDEFISPLVYLLDIEDEDAKRFVPHTLSAIHRLAAIRPQTILFAIPLIEDYLDDENPLVSDLTRAILQLLNG